MKAAVLKYGGSSLEKLPHIESIAERLAQRARKERLAVVLSAMGNETDRLVQLARAVSPHPARREMDLLLSTGEMVSISLMSLALKKRGVPCIAYTGFQAGIVTDGNFSRARILRISTDRVLQHFAKKRVVLVAGFQGIGENMEITTLGRGGSDTTAVALAAALSLPQSEIYTDVPGVFTADPRIVPSSRRIRQIGYEEMLELASVGAQVLHPRAVEIAKEYRVAILVGAAHRQEDGTMVTSSSLLEKERSITSIACEKDVVKISVVGLPDQPGTASMLFQKIAQEEINVDQISQGGAGGEFNDISFTVKREDAQTAYSVAEQVGKTLGCRWVRRQEGLAKVSVVGAGMITRPGVAGEVFAALGKAKINIEMISTSEIRISCLVKQALADKAVRTLHRQFFSHASSSPSKKARRGLRSKPR